MFADAFLPNLAIFALGVATAVFWLRTGMVRRGIALLVLMLAAADAALLARFALAEPGRTFFVSLAVMQIGALCSAAWLGVALVRRRWSADARQHQELFASALRHYLRGEFEPAQALLRRLCRADPWDVAATVALANVLWRRGQTRKARACLRAARSLDRRAEYSDFVAMQLRRLGS